MSACPEQSLLCMTKLVSVILHNKMEYSIMMMNNNKSQKSVIKTGILVVICSSVPIFVQAAGVALSDQSLADTAGENGYVNSSALQKFKSDEETSKADHQKEAHRLVSQNNQNIQEKNLEGSEMSDYLIQKKKADDKARILQDEKTLPVNNIVYKQSYDNITVTYPNGITIEMR
jgi:hypothetical protein